MLAAGLLIAVVAGCQKQQGPAEPAGRTVDQAVEKVGQQMEKAGEKAGDNLQGIAKGSSKP